MFDLGKKIGLTVLLLSGKIDWIFERASEEEKKSISRGSFDAPSEVISCAMVAHKKVSIVMVGFN